MKDFKFNVATSSKPKSKRKKSSNPRKASKICNAIIVYIKGISCAKIEGTDTCYVLSEKSGSIKGLKTIYTGIENHGHKIMLVDPIRETKSLGRHKYRIATKIQGYITDKSSFHITKQGHAESTDRTVPKGE